MIHYNEYFEYCLIEILFEVIINFIEGNVLKIRDLNSCLCKFYYKKFSKIPNKIT